MTAAISTLGLTYRSESRLLLLTAEFFVLGCRSGLSFLLSFWGRSGAIPRPDLRPPCRSVAVGFRESSTATAVHQETSHGLIFTQVDRAIISFSGRFGAAELL